MRQKLRKLNVAWLCINFIATRDNTEQNIPTSHIHSCRKYTMENENKNKIKDFRVNIVAKVQVLKSTQMDKKHAQFNDCFPLILLLNSCAAISLFHPLQMLQSLIYRTNVSSAHKEHL